MKKIAILIAVFALILLLTKIANQVPPEQLSGVAFSLKAQQVVQCSPTEITLVDTRHASSHLEKGDNWPDCGEFHKGELLDFYLSRGEKTKFLHMEKSSVWRKLL